MRKLLLFILACLCLLPTAPASGPQDGIRADVVIRGATIHDGTGGPGRVGDLAIAGDRIVAVGDFQVIGSPRVIDGKGLVIAPGFIDLHTHSDVQLTQPEKNANLCYLKQGVTTVVTGNCGFGPVDVAGQFAKLEKGGVGSNVLHLVPHNALRERVMKNANRAPTDDELAAMERLVEQGVRDGAWGLSTGLIYNPGTYAKTDELVALAKAAARHGGLYASHIRDEGTGVLAAIEEAIRIARLTGMRVHISHIKVSGWRVWGKAADVIALVRRARREGLPVSADQYPYTASSTSLTATVIPARYREGTAKDLIARLDDPESGPKMRQTIGELLEGRKGGKSLRIAAYKPRPEWQGKDLETIAKQEKKSALDIVIEITRGGGAAIVNFGMSEEDVRLFMKQDFVATASDGSSQVPSKTVPHPRSYGCFARKIGKYAIEDKVIPLEQAIRSASGLPADILKLPERGYLKKGYYADVVVFDPQTYRDKATYDQPHQYATGVRYLFVNGRVVIDRGEFQNVLAGRVLRHKE
jgi:N-acyl-D-aspartate/D-glutamate deacylase